MREPLPTEPLLLFLHTAEISLPHPGRHVERGKFIEMLVEIEKTHTGPVVVLFRMLVQKAPSEPAR